MRKVVSLNFLPLRVMMINGKKEYMKDHAKKEEKERNIRRRFLASSSFSIEN